MICKRCAYWEVDIDPETGVEIHRCDCCASPRLDDVTGAGDWCEFGEEEDHGEHDAGRSECITKNDVRFLGKYP